MTSWKRASHLVLQTLVRWSYFYSAAVVSAAIALFVASMLYAAHSLVFVSDRAGLVNSGEKFARLGREFSQEFPNNQEIVVLVDGGSLALREAFVDALALRLKAQPQLFTDVFEKSELPFLKTHALAYLEVAELEKVVASLSEAKGTISSLSSQSGIGSMLASGSHDLEKMLPMLNEILGQFLTALETRGHYQFVSPWEKAFFEGAEARNGGKQNEALKEASQGTIYNTIANGEMNILLVRQTSDTGDTIQALRKEVDRLRPSFPDLNVGVTGEEVLDDDEMASSISDSTRATLWSLLLVSVAFFFSFRYLSRPIMALFTLALSMGWTIGFTTLAIGHLNLLTVTFATMLLGLGTDFGIHFIYGYEEQRGRGLPPYEAMQETMEGAGVESFTGAITTAIAFFAITFTDFTGVAELGLIAGTGVLLSFLGMATVVPALIFIQERRSPMVPYANSRPAWAYPLSIIERYYLSRPRWVIFICACLTLVALSKINQVNFDYNLLNLQSKSLPSVQTELKMVAANSSALSADCLADNMEEATRLSAEFAKVHTVDRVDSVMRIIPSDYERKIPLLKKIQATMAGIALPNADGPAGAGTGSGLMKMGEGFMQLQSSFEKSYPELIGSPNSEVRVQARRFKLLLKHLFGTLEKMGPGPISDGVTTFQKDLFTNLRGMLEFLKAQRAEPPITFKDLPEQIRIRSIGKTGKILLRIYPHGNPWDREFLQVFVPQLQKVDPNVIGTPIMVYYHVAALKRAFEVSGWYALSAIAVVLFLHFRGLRNTLLALLPKIVGVIWMVGIMAHFHEDFNPANFMALPLILGIGLIFGVHVVHRLLHDPFKGVFSHSTGPAIALSACTTMSGFGTLMLAKHQGIASLGFLMTVGVGASLITSVVLLPCVMRVITKAPPLLEEDEHHRQLPPSLSDVGLPS